MTYPKVPGPSGTVNPAPPENRHEVGTGRKEINVGRAREAADSRRARHEARRASIDHVDAVICLATAGTILPLLEREARKPMSRSEREREEIRVCPPAALTDPEIELVQSPIARI